MVELDKQQNVERIVYPFAELIEAPDWIEPKPEDLIALQSLYKAHNHPDFSPHSARDYSDKFTEPTHCLRLPMQLALGLHAAGPSYIDAQRLHETFSTYASVKSIVDYEGGEKAALEAQRKKLRMFWPLPLYTLLCQLISLTFPQHGTELKEL